jgi:Cytochrome c peroxidase
VIGSNAVRSVAGLGFTGLLLLSALFEHARKPALHAEHVGARAGLSRPWPAMVVPADNPTTPAKVELGRLLFSDSVLSNNNTISCAHCHHPDLGFSDGLPRARGYGADGAGRERSGGALLARRTPTLWNTGYAHRQYWDGRAKDLEDQCRFPITLLDEMKQDPETLVAELHHIPEYEVMFDRVFGGKKGSSVSLENVTRAIAAFERTLISRNSRFDKYAAGNEAALTASEKRGLDLFFSSRTRCSECHAPPNFATADFKVTGVPDVPGLPPDPHKKEAEPGHGGGPTSAFKIPTLRNVALKAPYMHNGSLKTLSDVIDFYANGGGRGKGLDVPLQDERVRKFAVTPQEKSDLIAFLGSLTDVSGLPPVPKEVPSGLPVVPRFVKSVRAKLSHPTRDSRTARG